MFVAQEEHPYARCDISCDPCSKQYTGTLTYKGFVNGSLSGNSLEAITHQFNVICDLIDNHGAMLRRGSIMLGYHNRVLKGDVLLPDGEVLGYWEMEEDDDWSFFIPEDKELGRMVAPSAWMLQDAIGNLLGAAET